MPVGRSLVASHLGPLPDQLTRPRGRLLALGRPPKLRWGLDCASCSPTSSITPPPLADSGGCGVSIVDSEQTTDQTFRVTNTPDGRLGVIVFVNGSPGVVLWLDPEKPSCGRTACAAS